MEDARANTVDMKANLLEHKTSPKKKQIQSAQEILQVSTDILQVQQECIMTKQALLLAQLDMRHLPISSIPKRLCNLPLLPRGEQDVASNTHDERRMVP